MNILTELSGYGHYGVCTLLNPDEVEKIFTNPTYQGLLKDWERQETMQFYGSGPTGPEICFWRLPVDDQPIIKLGWRPGKIREAMLAHSLLNRFQYAEEFDHKANMENFKQSRGLTLGINKHETGWHVRASFGSPIWDVIETEEFQTNQLPKINADLRAWWEDQSNTAMYGQYTTVPNGIHGPTLQIYHPGTGGL